MKRFLIMIICFVLLLSYPLSALAAQNKIMDHANLLSDGERNALEQRATDLANHYSIDIVIVTTDSLDGKSSEAFADDYFDENGYGIGPEFSGILLLLSMEYRDWAISTCGDAIYAVTDYGVQELFSQIAAELAEDQYYSAFCTYLDALEEYLAAYQNGNPIDGYQSDYVGPGTYIPGTQDVVIHYQPKKDFGWYASRIGVSFVIGLIIALLVLLFMRNQMNTARAQRGAASYLKQDTCRIGIQRDIYLYSHVSKVRRSENSSSGGGSSVHSSSSGRSHGGGHGKF